jgi:hypothetical protein
MKRVFYAMYQPLYAMRRFKKINMLISVSRNTGFFWTQIKYSPFNFGFAPPPPPPTNIQRIRYRPNIFRDEGLGRADGQMDSGDFPIISLC